MALSRINLVVMILLASAVLPGGGGVFAQTVLTAEEESRVWIEGRSNINEFSCNATRYDGRAILEGDGESGNSDSTGSFTYEDQLTQGNVSLDIQVDVAGFECGRARMNRDLNEALKSDRFPLIRFELSESRTVPDSSGSGGVFDLMIEGTLTIAGTSRDVHLSATGEILGNGRYRATGQKQILMTDYNVTPPSGLLGLVRAENELTVHFDLFANSIKRE